MGQNEPAASPVASPSRRQVKTDTCGRCIDTLVPEFGVAIANG